MDSEESRELDLNTVPRAQLEAKLPFDSETFDVIESRGLLEHVKNTDLLISECFRLLKPGGYVVHSTRNLGGWKSIRTLTLGRQPLARFNTRTLAGLLQNHGFNSVRVIGRKHASHISAVGLKP